jgi:S-DNA-T family DNA segregation ATPase FtsK/SpoIIIE
LDEQGAEVLLGRGDKLVKLNGCTETLRVQCPFVSEEEVSALTDHIRAQAEPRYEEDILKPDEEADAEETDEKVDVRFDEAVLIVRETQRCSTSWLQRKMTIGYNRAAKMVDMMERRGFVGPPNGSKDREVVLTP